MKRLLIFLAVCLGLMGSGVTQTAKAAASYMDTIYLTYRLSEKDTMVNFSLYMSPSVNSLCYDWGDGSTECEKGYYVNFHGETAVYFGLNHSWERRTGEVQVKIYGFSNIRNYLLLMSHTHYSGAKLVQLDLTGCTALTELELGATYIGSHHQLTKLDVSSCTALTYLDCSYNQLTELDVSKNTALTRLGCEYNQLTELDVTKNTALTYLDCGYNQLTELDVTKNTALTYLDCSYNQLTELDVSKNTALTSLDCRSNQLTELDVSKNTALTRLGCEYNQLTELDVSKNTALTSLDCRSNQLTELDVSKNTALTSLDCRSNQLTELDVSKNTALTRLYCINSLIVIRENDDATFDFSKWPSFDVARATDWNGGTVSGNILTFHKDTVIYRYDTYYQGDSKNVERLQTFMVIRRLGDTVASPVFTPNGGEYDYCSGGVITINCETEGATIYYHFSNGVVIEWKEYTEPIPIKNYSYPIKAKAVHNRYITESPEVEAMFMPKKTAKPIITPNGGVVERGSIVTISCDTADLIGYTVDGKSSMSAYSEPPIPIVVNESMTIRAYAVYHCYTSSEEVEASFTIKQMPKPVFTPNGGAVERGTTVVIHCDTANATIYYTVDGSVPTEQSTRYTASIVINEAMTIKAMAVRENYVNSEVATASFTIMPEIAKPVFTPNGGAVERGSTVAIHCDTANATIYYTLDGSVPTVQSAVYTEPIVINEAMTIKAMAVRENYVNSEVATASFTIKPIDPVDPIEPEKPDTVKMPVFTPAGGEVEQGATVTISCATANATIYYTVDGSVPTVQSAVYTAPIVINEAMTLKAMAVRENYVNSEVATASFTIKPIDPVDPIEPEKPDTVKMPVFTPKGGEVEKGATVTISCATANATIYYTTDGSVPTVQSSVYTEPIVINEAMTIKAMAVRENYVNSEVATATFTVATVANETEQTSSLVVYAQDRTICLSEEAGVVSVYTMDGRRVFCGKAVRIPVSVGGLYIVHVAGRSYKLPVR